MKIYINNVYKNDIIIQEDGLFTFKLKDLEEGNYQFRFDLYHHDKNRE